MGDDLDVEKLTPAIGAILHGVDPDALPADLIYRALLDNLVIFLRGVDITPAAHLAFAQSFGDLDEPHPLYPHVEGYDRIMLLDNDLHSPPDTNSWHTDLTYKARLWLRGFCHLLAATRFGRPTMPPMIDCPMGCATTWKG